jgi:RNA polymerase sigma-70 factor (ECF subfamily)
MRTSELAQLLKDELAPLGRFALFLTKSYEDAEDLAQDTMERALKKAHLFDGENLRSWLFTVCQRIFLNKIRKERSRGVSVDIDDAPQSAVSAEAGQEWTMRLKRTANCMERLPDRDSSLLALIVFQGARYDDAARALRVPIGTVRSRLSRARSRLQHLVETPDQGRAGTCATAGSSGRRR